jgi:hypothetical protein
MAQTDFTIGVDNFDDLEINETAIKGFFFFYDRRRKTLIKRFILAKRDFVTYECRVTLIEKGGKFTPRLEFSIRDNKNRIVQQAENGHRVRARVDLKDCHDAYWSLFRYVSTFLNIEIPRGKFSLVSHDERDIVEALRERGAGSLRSIIRQLSSSSS